MTITDVLHEAYQAGVENGKLVREQMEEGGYFDLAYDVPHKSDWLNAIYDNLQGFEDDWVRGCYDGFFKGAEEKIRYAYWK